MGFAQLLDQDEKDKPCSEPPIGEARRRGALESPAKLPRTLDFVKGVVQVRDQSGSCGDPSGFTSSTKLSVFNVQGRQLRKIFETPLWDSTTQAQGRQLVQRWKVSFGEGSLQVKRCIEGGECDDPEEFVYSKPGGKYVRK